MMTTLDAKLPMAPALEMATKPKLSSAAKKVFDAMRAKIRSVFPDDDADAWKWSGEDFEEHQIDQPTDDFNDWLSNQYLESDEFTQRFVRRMFTIWDEMEREGFEANDRELYEHQKALFAWIAIETATGVRDKVAKLLVRSPYGSGKSLVSGGVVRAFRETQEELLVEGMAENAIPTGILLGLRKEHMLQNALGQQYAVMQPPYTVERADINVYYKNLCTMFGEDFSACFMRPSGKKHPFYDLFQTSDDDDELMTSDMRLTQLVSEMTQEQQTKWKNVSKSRRKEILTLLKMLIDGEAILLPDAYQVPQIEKPLPREDMDAETANRYRGDSAYALKETENYRLKASHKHLALNKSTYTTKPDTEHPAQFCIAYGSMVTRAPDTIRADIHEEIMNRVGIMLIDEAGSYNPLSLGDSARELSGAFPRMIGFTGQDRGIDGWGKRSPVLSEQKMVELGLMKPIAFQGIGDAQNPTGEGSEEAWNVYRGDMFNVVQTATKLKLPQPYELDTVVIAPTSDVREYAHRIIVAHEQEGIPVKVWCFDPAAGDSRWSTVVNGFNGPKNKGDPRRILVSPPSQMAEALHLHAECYDVLANMKKYPLDQARGRLGHIRNNEETEERWEKARTYFRIQWLEGASGEPYIREVAQKMGYEIDPENGMWRPLHVMIDKDAYDRDEQRKGLSEPVRIPDAAAVTKRKGRKKEKKTWTPLQSTSPFVIERDRRADAARLKKMGEMLCSQEDARTSSNQPVTPIDQPLRQDRQKEEVAAVQTPPELQIPAPVVVKPGEKKQYDHSTATNAEGNRTIVLVTEKNGWPINLENLAQDFGLGKHMSTLMTAVLTAYHTPNSLRGDALAQAVLSELIILEGLKK